MRTGQDLGTYHVRVEFADGRGFISVWNTGRRYTHGTAEEHPLTAEVILPCWVSEDDLFGTMVYQFTDGNYGCDCNRLLFLARAAQQPEPEDVECGKTIVLAHLTAIRPNGSEVPLVRNGEEIPR